MAGSYLLIATLLVCVFAAGAIFTSPRLLAQLQEAETPPWTRRAVLFVLMIPLMLAGAVALERWGVQTVLLLGALLLALAPVVLERLPRPQSLPVVQVL